MRFEFLRKYRSPLVAVFLWILLCVLGVALCHGRVPLKRPAMAGMSPGMQVGLSSAAIVVLLIEIGIAALVARGRPLPNLALRAPERVVAQREILWLWVYVVAVMLIGRFLGLALFGEGIAMHLNGSLVGATRVQTPAEVFTWAAYNGVLLAFVPYVIFRRHGYSQEALNLKSGNLKNDCLVIVVVLLMSCLLDLRGPNILQLSSHQQLAGGLLSFLVNLFGTDLPIMIVIYGILLPRYVKMTSPITGFLLGAASYPAMHIFESWTRYDTIEHAAVSVIFVFITFFPPGIMKSFLTFRTGNAWVHVWAFHAITPHVTVDTRLVVRDFDMK